MDKANELAQPFRNFDSYGYLRYISSPLVMRLTHLGSCIAASRLAIRDSAEHERLLLMKRRGKNDITFYGGVLHQDGSAALVHPKNYRFVTLLKQFTGEAFEALTSPSATPVPMTPAGRGKIELQENMGEEPVYVGIHHPGVDEMLGTVSLLDALGNSWGKVIGKAHNWASHQQ